MEPLPTVLTPIAVAISLLRQGGILDPYNFLTNTTTNTSKAMLRIQEVLSKHPTINIMLLNSLSDIIPASNLKSRRVNTNQRASLLRTFCDKVLLAWYARHPTNTQAIQEATAAAAAAGISTGVSTVSTKGPTSAILLALSVRDRLARVQTRGKKMISDAQASQAINAMGKYFQQERYASGVAAGLESIERSIVSNAAWIRLLQRLIDWDVKGWLCTIVVGYCSTLFLKI